MRWVHRELFLFVLAVIIPVSGGIAYQGFQFTDVAEISQQKYSRESVMLECFDLTLLTSIKTTLVECPDNLIFLGAASLQEGFTEHGEVTDIHPLLQKRFDVARTFAESEGINLTITSGFRSVARQELLYERAIDKYGSETEAAKWVLPPQFSHHPKGLAIDVNYPADPQGALWLERNGWRFGLCRVYANEWWHFEGVISPGQRCPALAPNALVDLG